MTGAACVWPFGLTAESIDVIVAPGELDKRMRALTGRWTVEFLEQVDVLGARDRQQRHPAAGEMNAIARFTWALEVTPRAEEDVSE